MVFDGNSVAVNARGELIMQLPAFEEASVVVDTESAAAATIPSENITAELYAALRLGLRDYLAKCGFKSAVLGLSGGIDSAVVAAIAADALGPENVLGVSMPSQFSSRGSMRMRSPCRRIWAFTVCKFRLPTRSPFSKRNSKKYSLVARGHDRRKHASAIARDDVDGALEQVWASRSLHRKQERIGGGLLTIYGDMAGGLAVISDVPKTMIYELARFINNKREIIPFPPLKNRRAQNCVRTRRTRTLFRHIMCLMPSCGYDVEENLSVAEIVAQGFDEATVRWVQRRVDLNEYKRAQAAPGLKVTSRAFGVGRRMPIAQRYVG